MNAAAPPLRDPLARAMLAAWVNCAPEQLPAAMQAHTCTATMEAWQRVGRAALDYFATTASAPAGKLDHELTARRIREVMDEGDGFWTACSGCQEGEDGYVSEKDYPFDPMFQCQPGGGCSECGGIGVLWNDGRGYGDITGDEEPASASAGNEVRHGLGPHALTFADDGDVGFSPVAMLRGGCVYIQQGSAQITLSANVADRLAAALARPRAAMGDWSFDMTSAPEGVDLLVYRHDGGTVPWVNGVRAIASKEDGEWYGDNGDAITTPAAWTALQSQPAKVEGVA